MRSYRQWYERNFLVIGKLLGSWGLSPNILTASTLIPAFLTFHFFYVHNLFLGLLFMVITAFFDVFDGSTARALNKVTKFGQFLDHTIDRIVDFLFSLGMAMGGFADWIPVTIGYFLMFLTSYVRAKSESLGDRDCDVGLMDRKSKVAVMFFGAAMTIFWKNAANASFIILGITSLVTVIQRMRHSFEVLK